MLPRSLVVASEIQPMTRSVPTADSRCSLWKRWARILVIGWFSLVTLTATCFPAQAHSASTAWLTVTTTNQTLTGQWEISLRDLDDALGLDSNDDGELTWGELKARHAQLAAYAIERLKIQADGQPIELSVTGLLVSDRADTSCAVLRFTGKLPDDAREMAVTYRLFFDRDPLHRGLANVGGSAFVFSPEQSDGRFPISAPAHSVGAFVREGVHHIWTGYDHLAFLFALLLPAVLQRTPEGWRGAPGFRGVLSEVVKVVTAFTLAHSLTLGLAAFEIVRLPARLVEATIAASIVVAVGLTFVGGNARTSGGRRAWLIAFGFGLIHGFGFAGVLGELGLAREQLAVPLLGFNAGVELGQLVCVLVFLPLAYVLRDTRFYRSGALPVGSAAIALLAGGWFVERAFDVGFMPF